MCPQNCGPIQSDLRSEAICEFQEAVKNDYKGLAAEANKRQIELYSFAAEICLNLLKILKDGRLVGRQAYEVKTVIDALKVSLDGVRSSLRIDDINNPFDQAEDERDKTALERLVEIMERGRRSYGHRDESR